MQGPTLSCSTRARAACEVTEGLASTFHPAQPSPQGSVHALLRPSAKHRAKPVTGHGHGCMHVCAGSYQAGTTHLLVDDLHEKEPLPGHQVSPRGARAQALLRGAELHGLKALEPLVSCKELESHKDRVLARVPLPTHLLLSLPPGPSTVWVRLEGSEATPLPQGSMLHQPVPASDTT